ncbi:MAG TPA: hypothetical protein ENJ42_03945 [Hellea balneolensis]|uniref:DUF6249 domain-containing protein n=1 Tax=Hellea balneolensis TaxID=287478 RepID=A0A7C5R3Y5_9PROT|nr:hypothetical protein [Hellea balneolensis]
MQEFFQLLIIFGTLPMMIFLGLHHKYKSKAKNVELVKTLIEHDKEVTPEIIEAVGFTPKKRHADLQFGMILVASSLAIMAFGAAIPDDPDASSIVGGIAMLPLFIGLAMLLFWFFVSRKEDTSS